MSDTTVEIPDERPLHPYNDKALQHLKHDTEVFQKIAKLVGIPAKEGHDPNTVLAGVEKFVATHTVQTSRVVDITETAEVNP